jgi:DNA-binding response OmpR family regulator
MISTSYGMTSGNEGGFASAEEVRPKLLVVDDSPLIRGIITLALERGGYRTCCAAGGDEARAIIAVEPPAMLITDLSMPSGDGWELIAFCRARWAQLPILIVSGLPRGTRPEVESSANGYITKPFGCHRLLAEVARLVTLNLACAAVR